MNVFRNSFFVVDTPDKGEFGISFGTLFILLTKSVNTFLKLVDTCVCVCVCAHVPLCILFDWLQVCVCVCVCARACICSLWMMVCVCVLCEWLCVCVCVCTCACMCFIEWLHVCVCVHVLFTSLPVTPDESFQHAQFILGCYFLTHLYMRFCDQVGFYFVPFFHVFQTKSYWVPVILRDIQVCLYSTTFFEFVWLYEP